MKGAYALDVLVEDHFAGFASRGGAPRYDQNYGSSQMAKDGGRRAPEPNRGLEERAFADAVSRLQVPWPAGESGRVFGQLIEAFGASLSSNLELFAHQIDLAVHLESQSTIPQL